MKKRHRLTLLMVSISLALVGAVTVTGLLTSSTIIASSGTVKTINVEVYWDSGCTDAVSQIDWENPEPGESLTKTVYIKNTGNKALTLNMIHTDWVPSEAGDYMTLTWDREGATLDPDSSIKAILTLAVSDSISGITDFTFKIIIQGTG